VLGINKLFGWQPNSVLCPKMMHKPDKPDPVQTSMDLKKNVMAPGRRSAMPCTCRSEATIEHRVCPMDRGATLRSSLCALEMGRIKVDMY
jgi:hypothetical protein